MILAIVKEVEILPEFDWGKGRPILVDKDGVTLNLKQHIDNDGSWSVEKATNSKGEDVTELYNHLPILVFKR